MVLQHKLPEVTSGYLESGRRLPRELSKTPYSYQVYSGLRDIGGIAYIIICFLFFYWVRSVILVVTKVTSVTGNMGKLLLFILPISSHYCRPWSTPRPWAGQQASTSGPWIGTVYSLIEARAFIFFTAGQRRRPGVYWRRIPLCTEMTATFDLALEMKGQFPT